MEDFLTITSINLKSNNYSNINIVLGNESCDLDSAVSALVYAAYLRWQYEQIKCKVCTRTLRNNDSEPYKDDIFVPILNVDREDFDIKTEVVSFFTELGLDREKLIFRNDYALHDLIKKQNSTVTLVDHHVPSKKDLFVIPYVTEIIDHRPLDNNRWNFREDVRSTIEVVGSCCTLVCERIKTLSGILKEMDFFNAHPVAVKLLHNTIILDTVNFSKDLKKGTLKDEESTLFLESLLNPGDVQQYRQQVLSGLQAARSDVRRLTAAQLLKKDFKVQGNVLVPSFPVLVEEVLRRANIREALDVTLVRHGCSLALLLGMSLAGGGAPRRDVAVYCTQPHRATAEQLIRHLQEWRPSFKLRAGAGAGATPLEGCAHFAQHNLAASRKQFAPAVEAFLRAGAGAAGGSA